MNEVKLELNNGMKMEYREAVNYIHRMLMDAVEGTKMSLLYTTLDGVVARLTYSYQKDPGILHREVKLVRQS